MPSARTSSNARNIIRACTLAVLSIPFASIAYDQSKPAYTKARNAYVLATSKVDELPGVPAIKEYVKEDTAVIYFTAAWCGPCQKYGPVYAQAANQFKTIKFGKVDVSNESAYAYAERTEQLRIVPTTRIYVRGKLRKELVGFKEDYTLENELEKIGKEVAYTQ